jgi:hypothetical protein
MSKGVRRDADGQGRTYAHFRTSAEPDTNSSVSTGREVPIASLTQCDAKCGVRVPCDGGGKRLHFHGVPEEVNASIPASAHSTSCSSVAPPTPSAPSTWPARMMGRPPGRLISGAPSPMTVAVRKYSEPSIDSSPLGRPDLAEANAFPIDARLASANAPSIRWRATRRPSASQTVTLMLTARLCALARAAWMARFASASLIDMSFA